MCESSKTIQCIATCSKNLPELDGERKSTLIVAPAALLEQVCLFVCFSVMCHYLTQEFTYVFLFVSGRLNSGSERRRGFFVCTFTMGRISFGLPKT